MGISYGDIEVASTGRKGYSEPEPQHVPSSRPKWVTIICCQCDHQTAQPNTLKAALDSRYRKCIDCGHVFCGCCTMVQPKRWR